jgi:ParB family chromosome partitioning protein
MGALDVLEEMPVLIREDQDLEHERLTTQLVANLSKPLTPIQEARTYRRILQATEMTVADLAQRIGRPRSTIGDRLRLLELGAWTALIEDGRSRRRTRSMCSCPSATCRMASTAPRCRS